MRLILDRFITTGDITRNPVAGQTGLTTIAEDVPCTKVYPANARDWLANFGTDVIGHELYIQTEASVKAEDIITIDGKSYTIKRCNVWPAIMPYALPKIHLYVQERGR